jgi:hypothetical protein
MSESKGPSTEAIALYTNVFGCVPDTEALEAGDVWEIAHIDAALRRAKAEGIRMVETYARACVHERAVQLDGFTGSSGMAGVIRKQRKRIALLIGPTPAPHRSRRGSDGS